MGLAWAYAFRAFMLPSIIVGIYTLLYLFHPGDLGEMLHFFSSDRSVQVTLHTLWHDQLLLSFAAFYAPASRSILIEFIISSRS